MEENNNQNFNGTSPNKAFVPCKNNRSCAGCYAYDDDLWKGWCALGFEVKQIDRKEQKAYPYGKGKQYITIKSKPAQPCTKPMTEREYVKQWRLRHCA